MDAQQCVKLTSTNRSIGLISHIARSDKHPLNDARIFIRAVKRRDRAKQKQFGTHLATSFTRHFFFDDLVVIARGNTPDPIPNSAVKTLSADGTPS